MVSKTQPGVPLPPPPVHLETIYEETGSSPSTSAIDIHHRHHYHHHHHHRGQQIIPGTNQTMHGLISARSIPSVDVHRRRRIIDQQEKPPIEVRNRDGTKCFIHSELPATSMNMNRRKYSHSSRHDSSNHTSSITMKNAPKYRQIWNTAPKKKKKSNSKPEIRLTIITADELSEAGITPPSTTSPDESETISLPKSPSNKTVQEISLQPIVEAPMPTIPPSIHPVQPIIDISVLNLHFPPASRHRSQHQPIFRHPQQISQIRSQSLPSSQAQLFLSTQQKLVNNQLPPVAVVPPSPKKSLPSIQITLTNDENDKERTTKTKHFQTKSNITQTMNTNEKQIFRPSTTVLVGGGSRSAFRPFHKSNHFATQPRFSSHINIKPHFSMESFNPKSFQQQQPTFSTYMPSYPSSTSTNTTHFLLQTSIPVTINPEITKQSVQSNRILSDNNSIPSTLQMKPQQSVYHSTNNYSSNRSNPLLPDPNIPSITIDSNLQWHSVTSKSLYDVPRLSNQYSDIPLRITLPEGTPTHNQKLLHKHDLALEKRLLDAGLSPETIALYERILEVANAPPSTETSSPPDILDPYSHQSRF